MKHVILRIQKRVFLRICIGYRKVNFTGDSPLKILPVKLNFIYVALVLIFGFKISILFSQCTAVGQFTPTGITNSTLTGTVGWSGIGNGSLSDNAYISSGVALAGLFSSAQSNYMMTKGYGFAIPLAASICGIQVEIERNAFGLLLGSFVNDNALYLLNAGVITGSNMASGSAWPSSDATVTYGGSSNLWGAAWTPADINTGNFGVALSTTMSSGLASLYLSANIDLITITIYYKLLALPIEMISFTGRIENDKIKLEWKTESERKNNYFMVEKMNETYDWNSIAQIKGAGNSTDIVSYGTYDETPGELNYYRVKQVDYNNSFTYSPIISVDYNPKKTHTLKLYPIPASSYLTIDIADNVEKIEIISNNGVRSETDIIKANDQYRINVSSLAPGIYIIKVYTPDNVMTKKFMKE